MDVSQDFAQIFERIYVINLDSRPDRLRGLEAQLKRVGLSLDGDFVRRLSAVRPSAQGDWPSIGALGCFMSHLEALRAAEADGIGSLCIVEDDLDFTPAFLADPAPYLEALKARDWRLFHGGETREETRAVPFRALALRPEEVLNCTHLVGFRGEAVGEARRFLEAVASRPAGDPEGGPMHVDGAYYTFRGRRPEFPMLTFEPPMGMQRPSASDVSPAWHDRLPFLRRGLAVARRLRQAF